MSFVRFIPKPILRVLLKLFLRIHSVSYNLSGHISGLVAPDGLNPKHRIMNYHQYFMDHVGKEDLVLDVGCGNGALAIDVARACRKVIGIDFSEKNVQEAKNRAKKAGVANIDFIVGDATTYQFNEKVDCVILSNVLEHIEKRVDILRKLNQLSDKFLIRVPLIDREWIAVFKKELGLDYRLDPTHFVEYTWPQYEKEIAEAGLRITQHQIQFGEIWSQCNKN